MHAQRLIAVPGFWPITNLTIYSTALVYAVMFGISDGVDTATLGLLAKLHAQLVCLVAYQVYEHIGELIIDLIIAWYFNLVVILASGKFST